MEMAEDELKMFRRSLGVRRRSPSEEQLRVREDEMV